MGSEIVIINSRCLQRPQRRSRENQFINRRLSKTKLTAAVRSRESSGQSDGYGGWCLE